jgi:hypothetical protein
MLNFMSPWMTQYTREKHEGKREPKINMTNRKSDGRKCGYIKPVGKSAAKRQRVIAGLTAHIDRHPNDKQSEAHLAWFTA